MTDPSIEQSLFAQTDDITQANQNAGRGVFASSAAAKIRRGVVTAKIGATYTIGVQGEGAATVQFVQGVHSPAAEYIVGSVVYIAYMGDRPIPEIIAGGGSNGGGTGEPVIIGNLCFFG